MPDWLLPVLGLFLGSSVVVALITAPLAHRVGMRTATAAGVTAEAARATAEVAARKVASDELDTHTREWQALFASAQAMVITAGADIATVRAENTRLEANLAGLHATHRQDMVRINGKLADTELALEECHALNRAVVERIAEVKHTTSERLETLERGQNGG